MKRGNQELAAAELALKAHVFASDPSISAETQDGDRAIAKISDSVNVTEAPEDAICSLVLDLMHYCEREKINWPEEIISVAIQRVGSESTVGVPGK